MQQDGFAFYGLPGGFYFGERTKIWVQLKRKIVAMD